MTTSKFWIATVERAVKTFAQALLTLWGADAGFNVLSIQVGDAFGVAAGAALLSVLGSIVSSAVSDSTSPSLTHAK